MPKDYFPRLLAGVAKTKTDDCTRLIRTIVNPSKMVVVVVGDAAKIRADLEKIAPVTVIGEGSKP